MGGRTLAIGDIHGCSDALSLLLDTVQIQSADTVVVLGDVIDRGPNSRGVAHGEGHRNLR
jgi:serine/threonine protein phosphatase 1